MNMIFRHFPYHQSACYRLALCLILHGCSVMSYYVIIPYSYMMRMRYEKEVFLLLVVFGVGTQQMATKMKI